MARRYKSSYRTKRNSSRFHVTFDGPPAPDTEEGRILARIAELEGLLEKYGENYLTLSDQWRSQLNHNRVELDKLRHEAACAHLDKLIGDEPAKQSHYDILE